MSLMGFKSGTDIAMDSADVILTNNDLIPQDRLTFYQAFNMLREYTADERIAFFKSYKNIDIMTQFYDDIRALKDQSYKSLVESCTQFTKDSSLYFIFYLLQSIFSIQSVGFGFPSFECHQFIPTIAKLVFI